MGNGHQNGTANGGASSRGAEEAGWQKPELESPGGSDSPLPVQKGPFKNYVIPLLKVVFGYMCAPEAHLRP